MPGPWDNLPPVETASPIDKEPTAVSYGQVIGSRRVITYACPLDPAAGERREKRQAAVNLSEVAWLDFS